MPGNWGLIDLDTPHEAYTKKSWTHPDEEWELVFSDEFNQDGRTFYPGDDPYWEAPDLHYWQTVGFSCLLSAGAKMLIGVLILPERLGVV